MPYSAGTVFLEVAPSFDGIQDEARRQVASAFGDLDKQVRPGLAKAEKEFGKAGERSGKAYGSAMERLIKTRMKTMQESIAKLDTGSLRGDFRALRAEMERLGKLDLTKLTNQQETLKGIEGIRTHINSVFKDVESGSRRASTAALSNLGALRTQVERIQKDTSKWLVGSANPKAQEAEQRRIGQLQQQAAREMAADFAKREQGERRLADQQVKAFREMTAETANREKIERNMAALQMRAAREMEAEFAKREGAQRRLAAQQIAAAREEQRIRRQINTEAARAENDQIRLDFNELQRRIRTGVVGGAEARAELDAIYARVKRLDGMTAQADVDVPNQTANIMMFRRLEEAIEDVGKQARKTGVWMKALDAGSAANSVRVFNGVLFTTLALGPLLIPVLGGIGAGIVGIGVAAAGALLGVGALALGLSGIGGAVGAMNELDKAQRTAGTPREQAGRAARARKDAAAIAEAERGLSRAVRDARRDQQDSAARVADAERDLSRARAEARRAQADAAREIADAERDLTRARDDAARSAQDAARRVADAEEGVRNAQQRALDAQLAINEARQQATRDLQDLNFQLRGAVLGEQEAEFALQEARVHYNVVLEDDQATQREKDKARVDMEQAQLALEEARTSTKRLQKDTAEANKKGVEGSDLVVGAKERERDAVEAVADAQQAVKDARADEMRTAQDNARSISDAERAVGDARTNGARVAEESSQRIADAQRAVADAEVDAARARVDGADRIADAQRNLADAHIVQTENAITAAAATGALATATDNLALAMSNLSPAGREFATFLFGLKPLLDDLRFAAQEGFLPGLQSAMQLMVDTYGPGLVSFVGEMSEVLGDLAETAAEMFTSPFWKDFFGYMAEVAPIFLQQFGEIGLNLLTFFAGIAKAFAPLGLELGEFLISISDSMATWAKGLADSEGFAKFTEWLDRIKPKVVELFAKAFEVLVNLLIGLAPYSEQLLDFLIGFFEQLASMDPDDLANLALTLGGIALAIQAIAGALGMIAGITGLFKSVAMLGTMFRGLGAGIMTVVTALFGGGGAAAAGGAAAGAGAGAGGAGAAAGAVGGAVARRGLLAGLAALVGGPVGIAIGVISGLALAFQLAYEHITPFREAVDGLVNWMGQAFEVLYVNYLEPFFTRFNAGWIFLMDEIIGPFVRWLSDIFNNHVKPAFENLWTNAIKPTMDLIGGIFEVVWSVVETFAHIIKEIFEHIVAPVFKWLYENVVDPIMDKIGEAISWAWKHVIKPVFKALGSFIEEHVAPVFEKGVNLLSDIWAGVLDMIRAPIRGVIDVVINRGLIGGFNWLADKTGMDKLDPIPVPNALQPGGKAPLKRRNTKGQDPGGRFAGGTSQVLPGYTPGRDVHEFFSPTAGTLHLSGGEGIARPEIVQAIGPARWNAANKAAREGRVSSALGFLGGFAGGGILPNLGGFAKGGILEDLIAKVGGGISSIMAGPAAWLKKILNGAISGEGFATIPKRLAKMAGGKAASGLAGMIQSMFSAGGEGSPGGSMGRLLAGLNWWKNLGARVSEHPAFGGVQFGHMKGSMHYQGRAGDLNYGPGGENATEKTFFDKNLPTFRSMFPDLHVLWRTKGHFNHMHVDNSRGDGIARGGGYGGTGAIGNSGVVAQVRSVANGYGWGSGAQWDALNWLINKESSWNPNAANPTSSARGLFQKMTSIHGPVERSAAGQAQWGLNYIKGRYGSPVAAAAFHRSNGYYEHGGIIPTLYDQGGDLPPGLSLVANKTGKPEHVLTERMMTEVRESKTSGDFTVDMRGSKFGYDPNDVASAISKARSDKLVLEGIDDGGDVW